MQKNFLLRLAFVLLSFTIATTGCDKQEKASMPNTSNISEKQTLDDQKKDLPPPTNLKEDNAMVATVNGTTITRSELNSEINNLQNQYRGQMPPDQVAKMQPMMQKQALENLINKTLLLQEAKKTGFEPEQKAVDDELTKVKSRFASPEQFQNQLKAMGVSEDNLRNEIKTNLKINSLLEKPLTTVKDIEEADVKTFYQENPGQFQVPEQIRASHILLSVKPEEQEEDRSKKRAQLQTLKDEIAKGADFGELARQHSSCPSKEKGGDLGFFGRGQMVKPFEEVAFNLNPDQVSDIVETKFGLHLIKLAEKKEAHTLPLEDVKDKLEKYLSNQRKQLVVKNYVQGLRTDSKIVYADESKP
ncbi:peptidylprolyl isomerase [candidate division CSSED10-310 bacterium]|uniref:Peptidylprolyl isomerase n=1 Tax=candidate division CSSED10-310 bacterium TaxID=2855610 RepID=A0ABV6YWN2_UNCC1